MFGDLVIGDVSDYILLFILAILPLLNKLSFWLYTIQLKEYRWDRFSEYLRTKQGKSALFNFWFYIEISLLLFSFFLLYLFFTENIYTSAFYGLFYQVFFWFLIMENLFVIGKIARKNILKPKKTGRLILLILFIIIGLGLDLYFFMRLNLFNFTYIYILGVFLLVPIMIFLFNFISLPLVNYKKNKLINSAIRKSNVINKPIKIGITGSFGKSSVKELLSSILEQDGNTLKTPENINTELGVSAIVVNKLNDTYKYFVAEMGAYKIGEIDLLGKIVNHKYGFLTAIGNQHIGLFGNQENIKTGKSEIEKSILKNNGTLYINWNNKNIRNTKFDKKLNIIKYGNTEGCDAKYTILGLNNGIIQFNFEYKNINSEFEINLIGEHNILNLTGILAFCYDIGLKTNEIIKYIKNLKIPKNTLSIKKSNDLTLIDDSYNLSQDGLLAGIEVLNSFKSDNKVLVLDDILELGKESKIIHSNIGEQIAREKKVDKVLFCGANYKKSFINGLIEGGFDRENILSTEDFSPLKKSVILFEGRKSKKYLDKINK